MNVNEIKYGSFTTVVNSKENSQIAYYNDYGTWRAVLNGYKVLMRVGLSELVEMGVSRKQSDYVQMLYLFMEDLEDELYKKGGDDEK